MKFLDELFPPPSFPPIKNIACPIGTGDALYTDAVCYEDVIGDENASFDCLFSGI